MSQEKEFFQMLSKEANYMPVEHVKPVYYALLRTILSQLRTTGQVRMPDWGIFQISTQKRRRIGDPLNRGGTLIIPETNVVKFTACERLREFTKGFAKRYRK